MEQFSYSFAVSMLHSIWQTGALLFFYFIYTGIFQKSHPVVKRNLLFTLLPFQFVCSLITFFVYYTNSFDSFSNTLVNVLTASVTENSFIRNYAEYFLFLYIAAVLYRSAAMSYHWLQFMRSYKKYISRPSVEMKLFTRVKALQFGINRNVSLWYSTNISTPMTFGFLKPVILMPVALVNSLSVEEAETLIIHELTHIRNHDFILNWMMLIMESLFFFNPFVRYITAKIKMEREKSCDTQVLQFNYCYISYAQALLKTAKQQQDINNLQLAAVKKQSHLMERIKFFSGSTQYQFRRKNYPGFSFLAILTIVLLNLFIIGQLRTSKMIKDVPAFALITPSLLFENNAETNFVPSTEPSRTDVLRASYALATQENEAMGATIAAKISEEQRLQAEDHLKLSEKVEAEADALVVQGYAVQPVSYDVTEPVEEVSKELVINEENSAGEKITKVYKVTLKEGKWIREPLYMITEIKPQLDSLRIKLDSLHIMIESVQ